MIIVMGIGNLLWADEGFGVRCVERLQRAWDLPGVEFVDGGTQGIALLAHVQAARRLLIFDAVDYGLVPGTVHEVYDSEVPEYLGARKISLHQLGFSEVLALARLTGRYPRHLTLIGCQPEELEDYGGSLRPCVRAALDTAVSRGVNALRDWGIKASPRQKTLAEQDAVTLPSLSIEHYEFGRPSERDACRHGDARFLRMAL